MSELNHLPPGHTRADFDFEYGDGSWGPIRLKGYEVSGKQFADAVWCRKHGWEEGAQKPDVVAEVRRLAQELARFSSRLDEAERDGDWFLVGRIAIAVDGVATQLEELAKEES